MRAAFNNAEEGIASGQGSGITGIVTSGGPFIKFDGGVNAIMVEIGRGGLKTPLCICGEGHDFFPSKSVKNKGGIILRRP